MVRMLSWRLPAFRLPCFYFLFFFRGLETTLLHVGTALRALAHPTVRQA
jgi:hypothetical protein